MRNARLVVVAAVMILAMPPPMAWADKTDKPDQTKKEMTRKEIVGVTPQQVPWFTPSYYEDGRQRARMFGDSSKGGAWTDRVRIPANARVKAHTHPDDEMVTVIEGTWYIGAGEKLDEAKLVAYPAGSFIIIPAGVPHFLATKDAITIVQSSGTGVFRTDFLEK